MEEVPWYELRMMVKPTKVLEFGEVDGDKLALSIASCFPDKNITLQGLKVEKVADPGLVPGIRANVNDKTIVRMMI